MNQEILKYALWNNKGGVGKTFLSFLLSAEYAHKYPDKIVVVIDMCPQANASEILLGGNGEGAEKLAELIQKERTIGGYFKQRILNPHSKTGTEINFLYQPGNAELPSNLHLVAGDPLLELQVKTINNIAVQDLPPGAWLNVHKWIIDIQEAVIKTHPDRDIVFFIDCNPSFSSYTEQAIVASERLIIPCSPDGSSARAIRNVFQLIYGYNAPPEYKSASFSGKLEAFGIHPPQLHSAILNKSTVYGKRTPSRAFQAMLDLVKNEVDEIYKNKDMQGKFNRSDFICYIPDAHSVAVICSSLGTPLYKLIQSSGIIRPFELPNGESAQINIEQAREYKKEIDKFVDTL